jgi:formate dehydrogenase subunit gamma
MSFRATLAFNPQQKYAGLEDSMATPHPWDETLAWDTINAQRDLEGPLLPVLHSLQEKFGYIDRRAIAMIAKVLNLSRSEVFGTISFYHDFKTTPPEGHAIKFCLAEACQARGAEKLAAHLEKAHGVKLDAHGAQNGLTVETAYCLGNCGLGPNALYDGQIFGGLDEDSLDALCARASSKVGADA